MPPWTTHSLSEIRADANHARQTALDSLKEQGFLIFDPGCEVADQLTQELANLKEFFDGDKQKIKFVAKTGYTRRAGGEFLDMRATGAGMRPKITATAMLTPSAAEPQLGATAFDVFETIAREFVGYLGEYNTALKHALESILDDPDPPISTSVLRGSRYSSSSSSSSISKEELLPPHTDASVLTVSVLQSGLEMLVHGKWRKFKSEFKCHLILWAGDFLELLGRRKAFQFFSLPHRISLEENRTRDCFTFLLRPNDGKPMPDCDASVAEIRKFLDMQGKDAEFPAGEAIALFEN